jgi:hypothetical protein
MLSIFAGNNIIVLHSEPPDNFANTTVNVAFPKVLGFVLKRTYDGICDFTMT